MSDLRKRIAALDGEISLLRELMERSEAPIALTPELVAQVADVFGAWADLGRHEKRTLLRDWGVRVRLLKTGMRQVAVRSIQIDVPGTAETLSIPLSPVREGMFKKMKRYGLK